MPVRAKEFAGLLIASRTPNLIILGYVQFATAFFLMDKPLMELLTLPFTLLVVSTNMIAAAGYLINDYFDRKIDMVNRPEQVIIGADLRRRWIIAVHITLTASGIGMGFYVHTLVGLIHIFSSLSLFLYSAYLKKYLIIDTLVLSLLTSLTLLIVLVYFGEWRLLVMAYALFGGVAVFVRESMKDIISTKGDHTFGIHSISSVWGLRRAKIVVYVACFIGVGGLGYYTYLLSSLFIQIAHLVLMILVALFIYRLYHADRTHDFVRLKLQVDLIMLLGLASIGFV